MDIIVTDLVKVMKQEKTFLKREQAMMLFFAQLIQTIVQLAFQQLDEEVSAKLKEEGFQVDRKSQRTVTFLFGSISYVRRRMKNKAGDIRYPLDEFLGIRKGIRYSSLVLRNVSELGSMMVYRHVAQTLVVHIVRTRKTPFIKSTASIPVLLSSLLAIVIGVGIVLSPVREWFDFVSLPTNYWIWFIGITFIYLISVEIAKRLYIHITNEWV